MQNRTLGARAACAGFVMTLACAGLTVPASAQDSGPVIMTRPQPRQDHVVFQIRKQDMVILGGLSEFGALAEEWIRKRGEWSYRPTAFEARYDQTVTLVGPERRERPVMFGGTNEMSEEFDGIWRRDRRTGDWILIGRDELAQRSGHGAVAGRRGRSILIFGGQRGGAKLNDTVRMTFDRHGFPELAHVATNGIPARDQHTMTWVPNIKRIVVQGGRGDGDVALGDTYFWDARETEWIRIADAPFKPRYNHTIYWDRSEKRLIAMGGTDGTEKLSDVWAGTPRRNLGHVIIDWVQIADDAVGAREGQSVIYNERRKKAVVFGGLGPDGLLGDTHKVAVNTRFYGSPTVEAYIVDDFTQDGDPVPVGDECPADLDQNGVVDVADVIAIYAAWGNRGNCPEDLDGDGWVRVGDVIAVLGAFGACE